MRALLVLRATLSLGILIPVYFVVALLLAGRVLPVLDYIEQLRAGAWLLVGYWVLRYLQGLFFEFFRFYWALRLRERPWLRWVVLAAVGVWWLLMVGAVVAGWLIAESRGISGAARAEYALNWFPAWLLTLPARAVADAVLAIFEGWTLAMGVMMALWAAGCLWLATRLTRDSRRIVDLVAVGVQLGAGKQTDEAGEVPMPCASNWNKRLEQTDRLPHAHFAGAVVAYRRPRAPVARLGACLPSNACMDCELCWRLSAY
jgi:hypothetical protein